MKNINIEQEMVMECDRLTNECIEKINRKLSDEIITFDYLRNVKVATNDEYVRSCIKNDIKIFQDNLDLLSHYHRNGNHILANFMIEDIYGFKISSKLLSKAITIVKAMTDEQYTEFINEFKFVGTLTAEFGYVESFLCVAVTMFE